MESIYDLVPNIDDYTTRRPENFPELRDETVFWNFYEKTKAYSMVHVTGYYNVFRSIQYLAENRLIGSLVECGCFLGGMTSFLILSMKYFGVERPIFAFDTFCGFPEGSEDKYFGIPAGAAQYPNYRRAVEAGIISSVGSLASVTLIEGAVETTIPQTDTGPIALLRLDTDHYDSTKVELDYYWPKVVDNGVIIVDDYGCYEGSRRATDECFARLQRKPILNRIDHGVFAGVKPPLV